MWVTHLHAGRMSTPRKQHDDPNGEALWKMCLEVVTWTVFILMQCACVTDSRAIHMYIYIYQHPPRGDV